MSSARSGWRCNETGGGRDGALPMRSSRWRGLVSVPDTGETKRVELLSETIEPQLSLRTVPKADAKPILYAKFGCQRLASVAG